MNFPIEYDPQTDQYFVIDDRPNVSDRFASQHDTREEAEDSAEQLRKRVFHIR